MLGCKVPGPASRPDTCRDGLAVVRHVQTYQGAICAHTRTQPKSKRKLSAGVVTSQMKIVCEL